MSRTVRDARLETRTARAKLPQRDDREPYWRAIGTGQHIGYYRGQDAGTWLARWRPPGGTYRKRKLAMADDVRDADGVRVLSYAQAQVRARDLFTEFEREHEGAESVPSGPYRVSDALDEYLAWFASHRKSFETTKGVIERYIRPALGSEEAARLTTARIRGWHEGIAAAARGTRRKLKAGKLPISAPPPSEGEAMRSRRATANRVLTVLRAALSLAYREGKIPSDTAWRRVQAFRGADSARVGYATEDQARRLLNACQGAFRKLVRGALETGCRYGELTKAKVADFNPDGPSLLIRDAKSGKSRHVPLDKQAAKFLSTVTAGRSGVELLFTRDDGERWGTSHQARRLAEANRIAQIEPPINFHGLRHTWASLRIMRGLPLMVAAQVLGHSDTRMVEKHYGHLAKNYVSDAIELTTIKLADEPGQKAVVRMAR